MSFGKAWDYSGENGTLVVKEKMGDPVYRDADYVFKEVASDSPKATRKWQAIKRPQGVNAFYVGDINRFYEDKHTAHLNDPINVADVKILRIDLRGEYRTLGSFNKYSL